MDAGAARSLRLKAAKEAGYFCRVLPGSDPDANTIQFVLRLAPHKDGKTPSSRFGLEPPTGYNLSNLQVLNSSPAGSKRLRKTAI
jgi:hypothetical protein